MENSHVIVLKTDIESEHMLRPLSSLFENHKSIGDWSVDLEDRDKVLRVVATTQLNELAVIRLLAKNGFQAEDLMPEN
ncbi:MAG: hypothetical protein CL840_19010 [Crocinitomicaceae bacterium]|nr:hypothetical protein [Crocinitomicaceae bacterium]|tara:strand:+ start:1428 stop:1661 length:234 start_codon:yes stop_codon:yes gene_type:complete